jgi:hypothetical protein
VEGIRFGFSFREKLYILFDLIAVDGPDDENWAYVTEDTDDRDVHRHASGAEMNEGVLYVYYSTAFPRFVSERQRFEHQNPGLAQSFQKRYELWITVHALLVHNDELNDRDDIASEEVAAELQRQERCRLASVAAMVAAQEVKTGVNTEDAEEAA